MQPAIEELIESKQWARLRENLASWHAAETAELLPRVPRSERVLIFRLLPRETAAEIFAHLSPQTQDMLLRDLTDDETRHVLANLTPDDRTQLLGELPARITRRLLNLLSPEDRKEATFLLGYPEESVGRLMTPDYVAVREYWTVREAFEHIRTFGRDSETINHIYVLSETGKLIDDIELRKFVLATAGSRIEDLMDRAFVSVSAFADREEAVHLLRRYDLVALPVVDSNGMLLGIVTADDLLDVAQKEATEDFHRAASIAPIRTSLLATSIWTLYTRRIVWLLALIFVSIFSGAGIAYFEDTIAATIALVFFLPLLVDSSGNAGSQAATLVIRAIATGEAKMKDWRRLFVRELGVASAIGLTMAAAVSLLAYWRAGAEVSVVVSLTMASVVVTGSLVGMSLPFLLSRLGFDPATASAPLVTSIADIAGVLIYFSTASWYLTPR